MQNLIFWDGSINVIFIGSLAESKRRVFGQHAKRNPLKEAAEHVWKFLIRVRFRGVQRMHKKAVL